MPRATRSSPYVGAAGAELRNLDPRGGPWLDGDRFGVAVHEVIADLARARPHPRAVLRSSVSAALARRETRNPALRARLTAMAVTWIDRFDPPPSWTLSAVEPVIGDARPDLAWSTPDAGVWFDEIKSGDANAAIGAQVLRHVREAAQVLGPRFGGIRLIMLSERRCITLGPDGTVRSP